MSTHLAHSQAKLKPDLNYPYSMYVSSPRGNLENSQNVVSKMFIHTLARMNPIDLASLVYITHVGHE